MAYVGLKFSIKGQTHFGWTRVKIASMYPYKASLTGYAYETIPNKAIITGETKGPDDVPLPACSGCGKRTDASTGHAFLTSAGITRAIYLAPVGLSLAYPEDN
jgi:hypothetical protein